MAKKYIHFTETEKYTQRQKKYKQSAFDNIKEIPYKNSKNQKSYATIQDFIISEFDNKQISLNDNSD